MKHMHQFEVSGTHFETAHFTPTKSLRLMVTMGKILGQPISVFFTSDDNESADKVIPIIIGALTDRLEESLVIATVKELFDGARIKNKETGEWMNLEFDLHFQGQLFKMFKVLGEIIKFQYKDFFEGSGVKGLVQGVTSKRPA